MKKAAPYSIWIVVMALVIITGVIYGVLLTHRASLVVDNSSAPLESLTKGEMLWESLSHRLVSMVEY